MENVVLFSGSLGNYVFNLFLNSIFNNNFVGFWMVNNFETLNMYSRSIE